MSVIVVVWLVLIFVLGAVIGSFLNVCIARLPVEKSLLWPAGSRCGHCLKPVRAFDNIPLVSYWLLRGKCRSCGASFSSRYFWVELVTGLGFAGLFYLEVFENIHEFAALNRQLGMIQWGIIPFEAWVVFAHHALLFSFLVVVAFCDLDNREIPLGITLTGTVIGLGFATFFGWPWPYTVDEALAPLAHLPANVPWWLLGPNASPKFGLYAWPFWWPLPAGIEPGSWLAGLAAGVLGALVGTFMLRGIRWVFSAGLGTEALGLGDADMMMMAGAFLGWQPVVIAFFMSAIPGLIFGLLSLIILRSGAIPFGPALALGIITTWLTWPWIGQMFQTMFFNDVLVMIMVGGAVIILILASLFLRLLRGLRKAK